MNRKNIKWVVLLYVLFLVSIWVAMWLVVFKNSSVYYNNLAYQEILENLHSNIYTKSNVLIRFVKTFNSNWNWFNDGINCPTSVTMSWNTVRDTWMSTTIRYLDSTIICESDTTHNWTWFTIYFNAANNGFQAAEYMGDFVTLTWSSPIQWEVTFTWASTDNPLISFTYTFTPDWYDDNLDSDDYKVVSTGSSSTGTFYPDKYIDDDTFPRTIIFWYLNPVDEFKNIFWNNEDTNNFIDGNTNNDDPVYTNLWDIDSWYMILTVDWTYDLKIVQFDRDIYSDSWILEPLYTYKWSNLTWLWYIQSTGALLLSSSWSYWFETWDEFIFDFSNNDYAVFLKNSWVDNFSYNLTVQTTGWTWAYINPIDDSWEILRYLWNDIFIDKEGRYSPAQFVVTSDK